MACARVAGPQLVFACMHSLSSCTLWNRAPHWIPARAACAVCSGDMRRCCCCRSSGRRWWSRWWRQWPCMARTTRMLRTLSGKRPPSSPRPSRSSSWRQRSGCCSSSCCRRQRLLWMPSKAPLRMRPSWPCSQRTLLLRGRGCRALCRSCRIQSPRLLCCCLQASLCRKPWCEPPIHCPLLPPCAMTLARAA